jgi:PAS domain S-box-containing protein
VSAKILIVEDENIVAMDIAATLRRLGYEVLGTAARGEQAVELAGQLTPDLVLMDIMLAGPMDGVQAAAAIRARRDVPVVFLTAYTDDRSIARATQTEPYGFIVKPYHDRDLRSAVEVALHKHEAEQRRQGSEHWLAQAFRALGEGVVACDPEGRVSFVNPAAEALLGWSASEAVGLPSAEVLRLVSVDSGEPAENPLARALQSGVPVLLPDRTSLLTRDGRAVPIDECAAPVFDPYGRLLGAVVVFRDGSARRRLQARLLLADRMAAVGVLAAGIGHEINNPMAYVLANLEFAAEELARVGGDTERVIEVLREARQGGERVARLARQLRTWARSEEERPAVVKLHALLDAAIRMSWAEIRHRARLVKDYGEPPDVCVDESRLTQAFIILLVNAAQAIAAGPIEENEVRIVTRTEGAHAVVEIRDDGAGIAPEHLAHVFEPFTDVPGAGLGLAVAHSAINGAGGEISVSSDGKGSVFTVRLPAAQGAVARPAPAVGRPRVLVVDDEPLICGAIERALSDEHEVSSSCSPRAALARVAAGERWEVILLDLLMPEMSGISFYEELDKLAPELLGRVVFLTGGAFTRAASQFLASGKRVIEKPFDTAELRRVVRATLG